MSMPFISPIFLPFILPIPILAMVGKGNGSIGGTAAVMPVFGARVPRAKPLPGVVQLWCLFSFPIGANNCKSAPFLRFFRPCRPKTPEERICDKFCLTADAPFGSMGHRSPGRFRAATGFQSFAIPSTSYSTGNHKLQVSTRFN